MKTLKKIRILATNIIAVLTLTAYLYSGGDNIWIALLICNVAFSFADYLSYNWSIDKDVKWCNDCDPGNNLYEPYRVIQYVLGLGLAMQLYLFIGWTSLLAFAVWHFTFNNDNLFYLWHQIFNFWDQERNAFEDEILGDKCSWAFFTPIGIYHWIKNGHTNTRISGAVLCFQSFIGIIITIVLCLK